MMNDDGVYIPEPTVSKPAGASSQRCGGASCGGCLDGLWEPLRRESHHLTQRQPGESLPALPVLASGREAKAGSAGWDFGAPFATSNLLGEW